MSHAQNILQDQLRWLEAKQSEAKAELVRHNQRLVLMQSDIEIIEKEMDDRDDAMLAITVAIQTLKEYGA